MAAVDYFLKLDGIKGESQDSKHKDEIELIAWSWGQTQLGAESYGGGGGAGKVSMQDLAIVKIVDKASPVLFKACADGSHIKQAVLTARKAGKDQQEYLKITLTDLLVSSFSTSGNAGDVVPNENVTLNFAKIEWEYKEQKPDGTLGAPIKAWFDLKVHKAG